ncbi:MAG: response regulator [Polyangiales bacterium]
MPWRDGIGAGKDASAATAVLHLEDNDLDAELVAARLAYDGLRCDLRRETGREGFLRALAEGAAEVILSDFQLPGYDGHSALADARAARPEVPFLFVSGAIGEEFALDSLRRGATDYVLKDHLERLAPAVRRALREADDRAERRAASARAAALQALAEALAVAPGPAEVARATLEQGVRALGAVTAGCWRLSRDGRALDLIETRGYPEATRAAFLNVSLTSPVPVAEAARANAPLWLESWADYAARYPDSAARTERHGSLSAACLPLAVDGRALGALAFGFERDRAFPPAERELLVAIARQCAQALDRARLYEAERDAREDLALLARAGEVLASSLDYEATLQAVAGLAMPRLGDFGFFDVAEGDGARRIARAHGDPRVEAVLQGTRWARSAREDINLCALSSGRAALHPDTDDAWYRRAADSDEHLELLRALAFRSMLTVPLVAQGRAVGALTLFFGASGRRHTEADLALASDLARRAALALENARLFREVRDAGRVKDEFLATVSHELRTPMTAILGWARVLPQQLHDAVRLRHGLEVIERNARLQARLIDDVLDVSRITAGKLRLEYDRVDLAAVVRAALDAVAQAAAAKGVELTVDLDPDLGSLQGDPARIQQVVWNLAWNAVKFTPAGGSVAVAAWRDDEAARVRVTDTGQGIDPGFLPHVFDRFRQADGSATRRHGGMGLGLAIARHLAELHGGTILAESEGEGRGATFTLVLPTARSRPPSVAPPPLREVTSVTRAARRLVSLAGARVLVVEDEADARDFVAELLRTFGAVVESADSVDAALARFAAAPPDVLVSDIGMPDRDGYELIRAVRALPAARGGAVPAVALTGFARAEDTQRALAEGFQVHLAKPVEPEALVDAVARLRGG